MAPRKRTTNRSTVESDREKKKQILLSDFDKQVEQRLAEMRQEMDLTLAKIDKAYDLKRMALSSEIRHMKADDYLAANGDTELAFEILDEKNQKTIDEAIEKKLATDLPPKIPRTGRKKAPANLTQKTDPPRSARLTRSTRKKPESGIEDHNTSKRPETLSVSTIQLKYSTDQTPATAFREPHFGEILYSIRGSPVRNGKFTGDRMANYEKANESYVPVTKLDTKKSRNK